MALTAPAGAWSLAEHYTGLAFADAAIFRTWTGTDNQTDALTHIHWGALSDPATYAYTLAELQTARPYILLDSTSFGSVLTCQPAVGDDSGSIFGEFVQDVAAEIADDPPEIGRQFKNFIGTLIAQLYTASRTAGYIELTDFRVPNGWHRADEDDRPQLGDHIWAEFELDWGALP